MHTCEHTHISGHFRIGFREKVILELILEKEVYFD